MKVETLFKVGLLLMFLNACKPNNTIIENVIAKTEPEKKSIQKDSIKPRQIPAYFTHGYKKYLEVNINEIPADSSYPMTDEYEIRYNNNTGRYIAYYPGLSNPVCYCTETNFITPAYFAGFDEEHYVPTFKTYAKAKGFVEACEKQNWALSVQEKIEDDYKKAHPPKPKGVSPFDNYKTVNCK